MYKNLIYLNNILSNLLDSLAHLNTSLAVLSSNLMQSSHSYTLLKKSSLCRDSNGRFNQKKFDVLLKKAAFPHELTTSLDELYKYKNIPDKKHFYSSLTQRIECTDQEHERAKYIFDLFKMKSMVCYLKVYNLLGKSQFEIENYNFL